MTLEKNVRFLLEKLLNSYRESKISYLNSADSQYQPSFNRFFNHQAIINIPIKYKSMNYSFNDLIRSVCKKSLLNQKESLGIDVPK